LLRAQVAYIHNTPVAFDQPRGFVSRLAVISSGAGFIVGDDPARYTRNIVVEEEDEALFARPSLLDGQPPSRRARARSLTTHYANGVQTEVFD